MASRALRAGDPIVWDRNRGRNGWDDEADIDSEMSRESMNVLLVKNALGQKRPGSDTVAIGGDVFTGYNALFRFVPGQNDAAAETFIVSRDATAKILRVAAGSNAATCTLADNYTARPQDTSWAVLNGKLFICYKSGVNRLHCVDPSESATTVRKVGIKGSGAPTVANTGAGTYPATERVYRTQFLKITGSTVDRQSNLGTVSAAFTPSGAGTAARVTRPAAPGEGETHWLVWGSVDGDAFFLVSTTAIALATTTYDDTSDPEEYASGVISPVDGAFTPPPSAKFILGDGNRLFFFGVHETATGDGAPPKSGRLYFTPALDTTDKGDDERVSTALTGPGYIDVGRNSGAEDRALAGPLDGQVFTFQSKGWCMFVATGDVSHPFRRIVMSLLIGAVSQESTFMGEDEKGRACLYWLDPELGPLRYGAEGLQWLGYEVQDVWETFNPDAANRTAHGQYIKAGSLRLVVFWIATGVADDPNKMLVFHVREGRPASDGEVRGGWVQFDGALASARCSAMLPATLGATMARKLKPYAGFAASLLRAFSTTATLDGATAFQAYVESGERSTGQWLMNNKIGRTWLRAAASVGVTIQQTLSKDYGAQSRATTTSIAAQGTETTVMRPFDAAELVDFQTMRVRLGDAAAVSNGWRICDWLATKEPLEEKG